MVVWVFSGPDYFRFSATGHAGQQGSDQRMEGASGQKHQRGCLQLHPGGASRGASALLPADPQWRAEADKVFLVRHLRIVHFRNGDLWAELDVGRLTDGSEQNVLN